MRTKPPARRKYEREPGDLLDFLKEGLAPIASSKSTLRGKQRLKRRFPGAQVATFMPRTNAVNEYVTIAFVKNDEKAHELLKIIERRRLSPGAALKMVLTKMRDRNWAKSFNYQPPNRKGKREVSR
jgi:hypothetical protein